MGNKITNYKQTGTIRTERVNFEKYTELSARFLDEFGVVLPDKGIIQRQNMKDDELRILCSHFYVSFDYGGHRYSFEFKPALIWDYCSVPKLLRSLIDNDDYDAIVAGMIHDYAFNTHRIPFKVANKLFYWLIRQKGGRKLKSALFFAGVASPIGRKIYNSKDIKSSWMNAYVDFVIV